jgi:hypothetical protein
VKRENRYSSVLEKVKKDIHKVKTTSSCDKPVDLKKREVQLDFLVDNLKRRLPRQGMDSEFLPLSKVDG